MTALERDLAATLFACGFHAGADWSSVRRREQERKHGTNATWRRGFDAGRAAAQAAIDAFAAPRLKLVEASNQGR